MITPVLWIVHMYTCRLSLQGRLDYANSITDDIIDSADRPLEVWCTVSSYTIGCLSLQSP